MSKIFQQINDPNITLYDAVAYHALHNPNRIAFVYQDKTLNFRELVNKIDQHAAFLESVGITAGTKLCLCLPNSPAFTFLFYAINKLGAVSVPCNPKET